MNQRKFKNFLLQPLLQIKLGAYSITLAATFSVVMSLFLYTQLHHFYEIVLQLTDMEEEVKDLLTGLVWETGWYVFIGVIVYLLINIAVSIFFTHRLIGPTYAFRRHIGALMQGRYTSRIKLRKGDAFVEVANDLNSLAELMEKTQGKPH